MSDKDEVLFSWRSSEAVFEIVDRSVEVSWRFVDALSGLCKVQGRELGGRIYGSQGEVYEAGTGRPSIKKTKVKVPGGVGNVDGVVVSSNFGTIGEVQVWFGLHNANLFTKLVVLGAAEDVRLKEIILWDGDLVLGDGVQGYEDLDGGVMVDGFMPAWVAVLILIVVAFVYAALAMYMHEEKYGPLLFGHYIAVCLLFIPVVRGLSGGRIKGPRSMISNAWQSWGFCGSLRMGDPPATPSLHWIFTRAFHNGGVHGDRLPPKTPGGRNLRYCSEMFTAISDVNSRIAVVFGFLTQRQNFGGFDFDRVMRSGIARCACDDLFLVKDKSFETDWMTVQLVPNLSDEPLADYCQLVADSNPTTFKHFGDTPIGWCSWYYYFKEVTAEEVNRNLDHLLEMRESIPLEVFQLDDGYQKHWGDWVPSKDFPEDMREVSGSILRHGFKAGIWLAPFAVDKKSDLAKEHPEWLIKNKRGKLANSGSVGYYFYGLDASRPEVMEFAKGQLEKVTKHWRFNYLKVDFIYAAVLADGDRYDYTRTRAQIADHAVREIRNAVGDEVFLVGCGCPLGSGIGFFNAMRIGPDVDRTWFPFLKWDKWNLPGARNAVRNTITRSFMHRKWWVNDPDCVLFRSSTLFKDEEIIGIATVVALGGGMLMLSDDMAQIPQHRYKIATSLMPPSNLAAIPLDLFQAEEPSELLLRLDGATGPWMLLALCNWEHSVADKTFWLSRLFPTEEKSLHVLEFWTQRYSRMKSSEPIKARIHAHSAVLFAIRVAENDSVASYIGSDFHVTSGLEVVTMSSSSTKLQLELNVKRSTKDAHVTVFLPFDPQLGVKTSGSANDPIRKAERVGPDHRIWKVPVGLSETGGKLIIEGN